MSREFFKNFKRFIQKSAKKSTKTAFFSRKCSFFTCYFAFENSLYQKMASDCFPSLTRSPSKKRSPAGEATPQVRYLKSSSPAFEYCLRSRKKRTVASRSLWGISLSGTTDIQIPIAAKTGRRKAKASFERFLKSTLNCITPAPPAIHRSGRAGILKR